MDAKINIALSVPNADRPDRYFSFRLQKDLRNEQAVHDRAPKTFVVAGFGNDFQAFCRLLKKQNIIDRYLKWQFKDGHLVILGNCLDKGEQMVEYLWLIYALEERARKAGGYVHFILGHHEIANINGSWRYMHPKYASATFNPRKPPTALYDANHELWRWLRTKNIVEKIGDVVFVSAGVSEKLLVQTISINDINNLFRLHYIEPHQNSNKLLLQLLLNNNQSTLLGQEPLATEAQIDATLSQFGVKAIVTGLATGASINAHYNRKIINIDPVSTVSILAGLLIRHGRFYLADSKGKKEEIK